MPAEPRRYLHRRIHFMQLPEDLREMEARLKAALPEIRFVSIPECRRGGNPELIYLDSLLDNRAPNARLYGWIQPEGWEPLWGYEPDEPIDDLSEVLCMNEPNKAFLTWPLVGVRERFAYRPLRHEPHKMIFQRFHYLDYRILICWYERDDQEAKRFAKKVLRLAVKDTDRACFRVDHETGLPNGAVFKSHIWIAKHARAWLRASPDRFLDHDQRPGDDPEAYRWELPLIGDLCMLKRPAENRPQPGLLYDERGRRRRVFLVPPIACPDPEKSR
jgi:hypothetical protein